MGFEPRAFPVSLRPGRALCAPNQAFNEIAIFLALNLEFAHHRSGSGIESFDIDKDPRAAVAEGFGVT